MLPSLMASQIYNSQSCANPYERKGRTCRPEVLIMVDLSMFLKSSKVFTFLMMPSALMVPRGGLGSLVLQWSM